MKKILLDLSIPSTKEEAQEYIARQMGFSERYGKNLDALYDELTSIAEPTAVGIFLPVDDYEPDIDLFCYFDSIGEVFTEAEQDNGQLAVIFGDIALNTEYEDRFDELYEDPYIIDNTAADSAEGDPQNEELSYEEPSDEEVMPEIGENDIILLDIGS